MAIDGTQLLTFSTTTKTGVPAFWKLIDRYQWLGRKHPGMYPIIEIQSGGYDDKRFGWVDVPEFEVVDWADRPTMQQLFGGAAEVDNTPQHDPMNDEIPF